MASPSISPFIYGTAWKKEETAALVYEAIRAGFTAFDTAAQPKHYREDLVGDAIREAFSVGLFKNRSEIYLQTKFSRPSVQDPETAPYAMNAPLEDQVHASLQQSLRNLRHIEEEYDFAYIDTLLLHSPYPDFADTMRAWRIFESYVPNRIRALGVSNITFPALKQLFDAAKIKPAVVQVRFHAESDFEVPMRQFCSQRGIVFQAHKVLKGNQAIMDSDLLRDISNSVGITREMALYLCVVSLPGSVRIVNGTRSEAHMREDLKSLDDFEGWLQIPGHRELWSQKVGQFKDLIGE